MDYHTISGYLSGFFEFIGVLPYFYSIISKKTKPNRATWFIWSLASVVLFLSYYSSGAQETLWQPGVAILFNTSFAVLSLKYGTGGTTKLDILCFSGTILSLILWYLTKNPVVGMTTIVIIGIIGSIPTILKVYKNPDSENKLTWLLWSVAAIANLFAIKSWSYEIIFYPIEVAVVLLFILFLTSRKRH